MPKYIHISITFEYLMRALFGVNYYGYVGSLSKSKYRKDLSKIFKYLKKSIDLNIVTDCQHKNKLIDICENVEKNINSKNDFDNINLFVIENLVRLNFFMIGNMPNNWNHKKSYNDKYWDLSEYRTINYVQSDAQKTALILNLVDTKKEYQDKLNRQSEKRSLKNIFWKDHKSNPSSFITWFKKTYPEIYCEIF